MAENKKTCLITGANSGIGKQAAIQIAAAGYRVIMACRNPERAETALVDVKSESGSSDVELLMVDMSLRRSIKGAAQRVLDAGRSLDVLIHNAASFDYGQKQVIETEEGEELIWATNHLGPVLLTDLLMPALERAEQGRIITISSKGLAVFPGIRVDLEDPEWKTRKFSVTKAYYQSKLAQVIYTLWLAEQLEDTAITVNSIRVTNVKIDLARYPNVSPFAKWVYSIKSRFSISPAEMAKTYAWLATSPDVTTTTGGYFDSPDKPVKANKSCYDPSHVAAVMELTQKYLADDLTRSWE